MNGGVVWAVCSRRGRRSWVSAVLGSEGEAREFRETAARNSLGSHEVVQVANAAFPVTIIEKDGGFLWEKGLLSDSSMGRRAKTMGGCVTFYEVLEPWRPSPAGRDEMGALPHRHIPE